MIRPPSPFLCHQEHLEIILDEWEQGNLTDEERWEYEVEAFQKLGASIADMEQLESN